LSKEGKIQRIAFALSFIYCSVMQRYAALYSIMLWHCIAAAAATAMFFGLPRREEVKNFI
jgi:hypothetical protein